MTRFWLAFTTPPQKERAAEEDLREIGFRTRVPMFQQRRIVRGKRTMVSFPAMRGYVFVEFPPGEIANERLHAVVSSKYVNRVVGYPGGRAGRISEAVMAEFVAVIEEMGIVEGVRHPQFQLRRGSRVLIKKGTFAELHAIVLGHEDAGIRVLVDLFCRSCETTVSPLQLEELDTGSTKISSRQKRRLQGAGKSGSVRFG